MVVGRTHGPVVTVHPPPSDHESAVPPAGDGRVDLEPYDPPTFEEVVELPILAIPDDDEGFFGF